MTASLWEDTASSRAGVEIPPRGRHGRRARLVIGVTSDQTCLVLRGRLRALRLAGFAVTVVSAPGRWLTALAEEEGVEAWPVPMERGIAPLADAISFLKLCWVLLRLRPVIADFSTPKCGLLGNLAAWVLRVPYRVYTLRGLKLESSRGAKQRLLLWAERVSAWCADVVLCNSESLRKVSLRFRIAPEAKLHMLGDGSSNGVDVERFSPGTSDVRRRLGILPGEFVIGFVGRLTRNKGIPELLAAFEEMLREEPESWLLLVGWFDRSEDALEARWRRHILGHPRIRFTDVVEDPAPYYRAMDVFVLPTHREGFPNVALEAAACGVPVITTDATGARDAAVPEVTGLVIPPGNPRAITESVLRLLRDEEERRQFGEAGRAWVLERYTNRRVLGLAVEFYRELLKPRSLQVREAPPLGGASANSADVGGDLR